MKITSVTSSATAQPKAHRCIMSGVERWYWWNCALTHCQWQSMGLTCSVMSDRSLSNPLAISHANPISQSIELLYTWCMTPMSNILSFSSAVGQATRHTPTHTIRAKFDNKLKLRGCTVVYFWHDKHRLRDMYSKTGSDRHVNIYIPRANKKSKRREILTVARSRVKWSRRWREVHKSSWMQYKRGEKKRETLLQCPRGQRQDSCDLRKPSN